MVAGVFSLPFGYDRIIEPIASRCAKFRFKPLNQESMQTRLQHVADQENVNLTSEVSRFSCTHNRPIIIHFSRYIIIIKELIFIVNTSHNTEYPRVN